MKKIIVVGATSAIAHAYLRLIATKDYELLLVGRDQEKLEHIKQDLVTRGVGQVSLVQADLSEVEGIERVAQLFSEIERIDLCLIATGVLNDEACSRDVWLQSATVNFSGPAFLARCAYEKMKSQKCGGSLMVIGSVAGDRGRQSNAFYGAQKAGVETFCQGLMHRSAHDQANVAVILLKPGFVRTPMTSHLPDSLLFVEPKVVAARIDALFKAGKSTSAYCPRWWFIIMKIIQFAPRAILWRSRL